MNFCIRADASDKGEEDKDEFGIPYVHPPTFGHLFPKVYPSKTTPLHLPSTLAEIRRRCPQFRGENDFHIDDFLASYSQATSPLQLTNDQHERLFPHCLSTLRRVNWKSAGVMHPHLTFRRKLWLFRKWFLPLNSEPCFEKQKCQESKRNTAQGNRQYENGEDVLEHSLQPCPLLTLATIADRTSSYKSPIMTSKQKPQPTATPLASSLLTPPYPPLPSLAISTSPPLTSDKKKQHSFPTPETLPGIFELMIPLNSRKVRVPPPKLELPLWVLPRKRPFSEVDFDLDSAKERRISLNMSLVEHLNAFNTFSN